MLLWWHGKVVMNTACTNYSNKTNPVVNGVELPENVITELRQLGIALSWYSASELQDAIIACAYDSRLIDDEHGVDLKDKIKLTPSEKQSKQRLFIHRYIEDEGRHPIYPPLNNTRNNRISFCDLLNHECEEKSDDYLSRVPLFTV